MKLMKIPPFGQNLGVSEVGSSVILRGLKFCAQSVSLIAGHVFFLAFSHLSGFEILGSTHNFEFFP